MFLADSNGMHWLDIVFLIVAVILIILSLLQGEIGRASCRERV